LPFSIATAAPKAKAPALPDVAKAQACHPWKTKNPRCASRTTGISTLLMKQPRQSPESGAEAPPQG
jgi:hypothetical protein